MFLAVGLEVRRADVADLSGLRSGSLGAAFSVTRLPAAGGWRLLLLVLAVYAAAER